MNTTFKSLAAAAALAAFGPAAQAATAGSAAGTGNGDVIFQLYNPATQQTFTWDLFGVPGTSGGDMTAIEFAGSPPGVAPAITNFSLSNATLDAFLAGMDVSTAQWRVLGSTNIAGNSNTGSPNFGALLTSSVLPVVTQSAFSFTNPVNQIKSYVDKLGNTEGMNNNAEVLPPSAVDTQTDFLAGSTIPAINTGNAATVMTGLGTIDFYYMHRDPTRFGNLGPTSFFAQNGVLLSNLGFMELTWNGLNASLNFNPVVIPVPPAVWLFGSALAGLAGVARRKAR